METQYHDKLQDEPIISPFGGDSHLVTALSVSDLNRLYLSKCNVDIFSYFGDTHDGTVRQYQCEKTGYKFWRPRHLAGSEAFYRTVSKAWPNYYRRSRWEYEYALPYIKEGSRVLEIGCGQGYFLNQVERFTAKSFGLELNAAAISDKACSSPIFNESIELHASKGVMYDVIASFQVLEHIEEPESFISSAISILEPGGILILSTPNDDFGSHLRFEDAFNLPPHHVGHYNKEVFESLADLFKLEVVSIKPQVANFDFPRFTPKTEQDLVFRIFRRITSALGHGILNYTREPGHTLLSVLRKPW